jgi:hypothetical protein
MFGLVVARPETEVNNDARFVQKQNRRRSRSCAVIIVEHSTKTLAPMHRLRWCDDRGGPQELVCEALMITFYVVVRHEVGDRVLKRVTVLTILGRSVCVGFYG